MDKVSRVGQIRKLILCFGLVMFLNKLPAQTQPMSEQYVLKRVSERSELPVSSLEYLQTASPEKAWAAFGLIIEYQPENPGIVKKAGNIMAESPAIETYVTEGLASLPHSFRTDDQRHDFLTPLGRVPAPWSLRLLGHYVMDETPITNTEEVTDFGYNTNTGYAVVALSQMGFSDGPQDNKYGEPAPIDAWRSWWKANENRVDQRIAEINPGYYTPTPLPTPVASTPVPTPPPIMKHASTPTATPKPTDTPSASPVASSSAPANSIFIYLFGGLLALAALGALAWAFRK